LTGQIYSNALAAKGVECGSNTTDVYIEIIKFKILGGAGAFETAAGGLTNVIGPCWN
jgi:hypothetical protein